MQRQMARGFGGDVLEYKRLARRAVGRAVEIHAHLCQLVEAVLVHNGGIRERPFQAAPMSSIFMTLLLELFR